MARHFTASTFLDLASPREHNRHRHGRRCWIRAWRTLLCDHSRHSRRQWQLHVANRRFARSADRGTAQQRGAAPEVLLRWDLGGGERSNSRSNVKSRVKQLSKIELRSPTKGYKSPCFDGPYLVQQHVNKQARGLARGVSEPLATRAIKAGFCTP